MSGYMSDARKYRQRAIKFNQEGKLSSWIVNIECHRVVGNYVEGETAALATDLGLDVSQVQNRALAARTFIRLRRAFPDSEGYRYVSGARKMLSPSHFTVLGRMWEKYEDEMSPQDALNHLIAAADGLASVRAFKTMLDNLYREDRAQEWVYNIAKASTWARKAMNTYGAPDEVRYAAREFIAAVEGKDSLPFLTLERVLCVYLRYRADWSPKRAWALGWVEKVLDRRESRG